MAGFVILLLVVAIYWPGLHGGFFFDDEASILLTDGIRFETLSLESIHQALKSGSSGPSGRPVAQLSFALNHYFSGFDPFMFKATNLAIHLAAACLVFSLTLRLLAAAGPHAKPSNIFIASGVVATLWLTHPLQLLPVLHVVQRMTSLSALFLLAALLLHVRGREQGGRAGAALLLLAWVVLWPLSFFSKETGALFPVFVLAWELILRRNTCGTLDRFARGFVALAALLFVAGAAYALSPAAQWLWSGFDLRPFTLGERLLTEGRVLWFYLGLIVAPRFESFGLYHDDIVVSTSLFSPWTTLPALAGLAGLAWVAWWGRTRAPLVSFCIAWFLIGHAMESTVLPLEIAHEHRNYLPILGILLAGGWALLRALEHTGPLKTIGTALTTAALAYFPFVTALRSHEFSDDGQRTQIEAQHHRTSAHAQYEAGRFLAAMSDSSSPNSPTYAFARRHYELTSKLDPNFKFGLLGLLHLNCKAAIPVERTEVIELSRRLRETPFAPGDRNVLYSLKEMSIAGTVCLVRSEMDMLFSAAFSNPTVSPSVLAMLYSWYADYLVLREHDLAAAQEALAKSLKLAPANPSSRLKWAQLILLEGRRTEAVQLLKALRNTPLSGGEKETMERLLSCLQGDSAQCGNI